MSEPRSLSPKEYAQRHSVTVRTVHRWIAAGRLRVIRFTKRTIRIVPASLNEVQPQPQRTDRTS